MIVVDSNIVAYLYLPGKYTAAAEALFESDPGWAAPVLWRSEFRNILAGYLRRGNLNSNKPMISKAKQKICSARPNTK